MSAAQYIQHMSRLQSPLAQCTRRWQSDLMRICLCWCRLSAAHAVKAIFGSQETYDYLPYFYSREFSLAWQFYGEPEGDYVIHGDLQGGKFGVYWVQDGKVCSTYSFCLGILQSPWCQQYISVCNMAKTYEDKISAELIFIFFGHVADTHVSLAPTAMTTSCNHCMDGFCSVLSNLEASNLCSLFSVLFGLMYMSRCHLPCCVLSVGHHMLCACRLWAHTVRAQVMSRMLPSSKLP